MKSTHASIIHGAAQTLFLLVLVGALAFALTGFATLRFGDGLTGWLVPVMSLVPFSILGWQFVIAREEKARGEILKAARRLSIGAGLTLFAVLTFLWAVGAWRS